MSSPLTYGNAEEIGDVRMFQPHVVVLGAGASRAACPHGDASGRRLPLMADFAASLGIEQLLRDWGVDPDRNFEDVYGDLHDAGERERLAELEGIARKYFAALRLPEEPTVYDRLLLSLRETDVVATFNWDPLLLQAYRRIPPRFGKPLLAFLHGCVAAGYCVEDDIMGMLGATCSCCARPFARVPILFPVRSKDYASDPAIERQWRLLRDALGKAFMVTVFGYSGPKSDREAIALMKEAWGETSDRSMEQTAFVTLQSEDEVREAWEPFIHTHHYEVARDYGASWIATHPRRTGEAFLAQYLDARFVDDHHAPQGVGFDELLSWFERLLPAERAAGTAA